MPFILPANTLSAGGYDVDNSLRFNSGSSDYLNRSPSSAGNLTTWTLSMWVKRSILGGEKPLFSCRPDGNNETFVGFGGSDTLVYKQKTSGSTSGQIVTNRVFRDTSAWYNLVFVYDINNGTAGDRGRLYVNGVRETSFATETYPSEDDDIHVNESDVELLEFKNNAAHFFDGYITEIVYIDGSQEAVTSFGEFDEDSGIFKPIDVSGLTFGSNGFYQEYKQAGTGTNSSGMGADTSGNDNHFAVNNLTAVDQSTDTCTNNFCTLNPLTNLSNGITITNGNLSATTGDAPWQNQSANFGVSQGKWYWETKQITGSASAYIVMGIISEDLISSRASSFGFSTLYSYGFKYYDGSKVYNEAAGGTSASYGSAVSNNDIVGIAVDLDNLKIYWSINGTWQNSGDPTSGATGTGSAVNLQSGQTYFPTVSLGQSGANPNVEFNFGSPPYSESGGNSDANSYGNFKTAPPSGYYALNTKNLAEFG